MDQDIRQRQVAYKISISDIIDKELTKQDGWLPNYIQLGNLHVSRVNIIGTVIDASNDTPDQLVIDDGKSSITIRKFDGQDIKFEKCQIGEIVTVIGRVREFNNEKYIMPEIVQKVSNIKWAVYRQKELELLKKLKFYSPSNQVSGSQFAEPEKIQNTKPAEAVVDKIKELDPGNGADINLIIQALGPDTERIINTMLEQGDIFSTQPGKIKVLE